MHASVQSILPNLLLFSSFSLADPHLAREPFQLASESVYFSLSASSLPTWQISSFASSVNLFNLIWRVILSSPTSVAKQCSSGYIKLLLQQIAWSCMLLQQPPVTACVLGWLSSHWNLTGSQSDRVCLQQSRLGQCKPQPFLHWWLFLETVTVRHPLHVQQEAQKSPWGNQLVLNCFQLDVSVVLVNYTKYEVQVKK